MKFSFKLANISKSYDDVLGVHFLSGHSVSRIETSGVSRIEASGQITKTCDNLMTDEYLKSDL